MNRMVMINRNASVLVPLFFTGMLVLAGCVKNEWEELESREAEIISDYLDTHNVTEEAKTEGGIYFIEEVAGTGLAPEVNDYVVISYVGRYLEDGSIHETNIDSLKDDWLNAGYYSYFVYAPLKFRYGYSIPGINEGLALMREGGKAKLIIPSDKAFYDFNPMEYEVELIRVIKDPAAWEDSILTSYLAANAYDSTMLTGDIYFRETVTPNPGDIRTVQSGDTIILRFSGRYVTGYEGVLEDGTEFDSNQEDANALKMVFGKNEIITGMILSIPDGLVTAIDSMRTGTHATAVLPYTEAFGTEGLISGIYGYTIVPAYQTVMYQLVLEDIRPPGGK